MQFRLLKDGKSLFALIVPLIWLIWHRLWLPLMAYLVALIGIGLLIVAKQSLYLVLLSSLPAVYLFLEGSELIRASLERKGWRYTGVIEATGNEQAEIKAIAMNEWSRLEDLPQQNLKPALAKSGSSEYAKTPIGIFPE